MNLLKSILKIVILGLTVFQLSAQNYNLNSHAFSNGAEKVTSGSYGLTPTVGQTVSGKVASDNYIVTAGFLPTAIPRLAELTVLELKLTPNQVAPGGETSISFTLKNSGGVGAFVDVSAEVYLSANSTFETSDLRLDSFAIGSDLLPDDEIAFPTGDPVVLQIAESTAIAEYTVFLVLYTNEPLKEIDEVNVFPVTLSVLEPQNVDITSPTIQSFSPSEAIFSEDIDIEVTVFDDSGVDEVILYHRPISGTDFESMELFGTGGLYAFTPEDDWADEFGMEAYFIATDQVGNSTPVEFATRYFWYRPINLTVGDSIPFDGGFDGTKSTYEMFSVPYELSNGNGAVLFDELGSYDKSVWRVFHLIGSTYAELFEGFNEIEPGKGYWFNTVVEDFSIKVPDSEDKVPTDSATFVLEDINAGWNQIGNPYPYTIDWSVVVDANPDLQLTAALQAYNNNNYTPRGLLQPWEGAFVFAQNSGDLVFPVQARLETGGRLEDFPRQILDDQGWEMTLDLHMGQSLHLGAIGMHPDADNSKDRFDQITVPRFVQYLEFSTTHNEFFAPKFSSDFVAEQESYTWEFEFASNVSGHDPILSWDVPVNELASAATLMLLDVDDRRVINMLQHSNYSFTAQEGKRFKIYYSETGSFDPGFTAVGQAYPNPFKNSISIPVFVESENKEIQVSIYDGSGRLIDQISQQIQYPGISELIWNGTGGNGKPVPEGVYYYRLEGTDATKEVFRLIKIQ